MPGVIQQARNFAGTAAAVVADGLKMVTPAQRNERLEICHSCQQYDDKTGRCFSCGCVLKAKAMARAAQCPLGKWPALMPSKPTDLMPFTGQVTRNLLMFLYPVRGPEWRRNLSIVLSRLPIFDGKRVFAIATDNSTDSFETVAAELAAHRCEVLHFGNRRDIGEVVAFKTLLERVKSTDQNEITYYCHAKGVTKQTNAFLPWIHRWTDAMHEVLLDGVDDVETVLNKVTFAGAFRAKSAQFPNGLTSSFNWHFPGTFFWFRNNPIFTGDRWFKVDEKYWGSEAWPGTQCPVDHSACLLLDDVKLAALYTPGTWDSVAQPALDKWRETRLARVS